MRKIWSLTAAASALLWLAGCAGTSATLDDPPTAAPEVFEPKAHAILAVNGGYGGGASSHPIKTVWRRADSKEEVTLYLTPDIVTVRTLVPGQYRLVSAVSAGRELLEKTEGEGQLPVDVPDLGAVGLDAGEVVYAGRIMVREETYTAKKKVTEEVEIPEKPEKKKPKEAKGKDKAKEKDKDKKAAEAAAPKPKKTKTVVKYVDEKRRRVVVVVGDDTSAARDAVKVLHPDQAGDMKRKLMTVDKPS